MDLGPGFSYILLVIPFLFACMVTAQGVSKLASQKHDGPIVFTFGILFFGLIAGAYVFFIR